VETRIEHGGAQVLAYQATADDGLGVAVAARDDIQQEIHRKRRRLPCPWLRHLHLAELRYVLCR
jgi:hypothetical protein